MKFNLENLDWEKVDGLIPAVIQNAETGQVLMLGYMNREALQKTLRVEKVTFWSRTRRQLWTKGETSGNLLIPLRICFDCDADTLLISARPLGPTCHTGAVTCFTNVLAELE